MIGEKTKSESKRLIDALIDTYWNAAKEAYLKADKGLSISLSLHFEEKEGYVELEAGINFVADRVKTTVDTRVLEDQEELFAPIADKVAQEISKMKDAESVSVTRAGKETKYVKGKAEVVN